MLNDDHVSLLQLRNVERRSDLFRRHDGRLSHAIETAVTNRRYAPLFLARLDQTLARVFVSRQQQMRQPRHRMSNHVVDITHHAIAGGVVRHRETEISAAHRKRDRLLAIARQE